MLHQPILELVDWATAELAQRGIRVIGQVEEARRRDWSLLVRIPTSAGQVWAKSTAAAFAHEVRLVETLDRLCPGSVLTPLAVHRGNGWLLSPDGGPSLEEASPGGVVPSGWSGVLRWYATLQQRLTDHVGELRTTGTPYLPPSQLISVYRHFEERVPGLGPAIEAAAAELEQYGRLTLEHNDLRPAHVFASSTAFFDWGDAVLTHPFLSVRLFADPLREDYFDIWRRIGVVTSTELVLAQRLSPLVALRPWLAIDMAPGSYGERFTTVVDGLLDQLRAGFGS
ncbi:hypothetical protein EBN03_32050 [Nocardia stercoris]|uniref:Aminoglycoside phosphotransferase domain-containing protein n=1 Tax=Nocardia stercoris TaxID=2483361 RepID=A0A3M2KSD0_9NOCA|nr:hypothetical protein EBN03_32050 [Nocardia stercoris]